MARTARAKLARRRRPEFGSRYSFADGIYSYVKDAVQLNLTGGAGSAGMPIAPFPGQVLPATISNNQSVMLLAKYVTGPLKLYAGYEWI